MGPPMPSRTASNSPSTGEPSPGWTIASAPVARTAAARSSLPAWPVTAALAWTASWTANSPTPPAAPVISTRSPAWIRARRRMPTAVTPATGRVAAVTKSQADGRGAAHSAGTTTRSAKAPPDGDRATTRSPTSKVVTPSPRAATVPATSQPMTVPGGCLAAVRTSPRLTEAASMSSRSWLGRGSARGRRRGTGRERPRGRPRVRAWAKPTTSVRPLHSPGPPADQQREGGEEIRRNGRFSPALGLALVLGPVFRVGGRRPGAGHGPRLPGRGRGPGHGGVRGRGQDPGRRRPGAPARGGPARPGRGRHRLRLPHPGGHLPDRSADRRRLVPRLPADRGRHPPARGRRDHLGRAPAGPSADLAALLSPGPGRGHLGDPAAARGAHRAVPLLDVRGPGAADRGAAS